MRGAKRKKKVRQREGRKKRQRERGERKWAERGEKGEREKRERERGKRKGREKREREKGERREGGRDVTIVTCPQMCIQFVAICVILFTFLESNMTPIN